MFVALVIWLLEQMTILFGKEQAKQIFKECVSEMNISDEDKEMLQKSAFEYMDVL